MRAATSGSKHRCLGCGGPAAATARYCPSCGAPLRGPIRFLGAARGLLAGGFLAAVGIVGPLSLAVVLDGHGLRATSAFDWYATHLLIVTEWLDLVFVAVGAALATRALASAGRLGRIAAVAGVSGLALATHQACGAIFPQVLSVVHMAGMVVAAGVGATLGVPVISWAARFAPFSWAVKLCRGRLPALRFVNAVLVFAVWLLLLPWFVVWLFATATGVGLIGGLLDRFAASAARRVHEPEEQVAS